MRGRGDDSPGIRGEEGEERPLVKLSQGVCISLSRPSELHMIHLPYSSLVGMDVSIIWDHMYHSYGLHVDQTLAPGAFKLWTSLSTDTFSRLFPPKKLFLRVPFWHTVRCLV